MDVYYNYNNKLGNIQLVLFYRYIYVNMHNFIATYDQHTYRTYIYTFSYINSCVQVYVHACLIICASICTSIVVAVYIHICSNLHEIDRILIHAYMHTYIHTYTYSYIHTFIRTYRHTHGRIKHIWMNVYRTTTTMYVYDNHGCVYYNCNGCMYN